ncbi:hypothetical protein AB4Z18_15825 [Leifsonia sp. 2TAF2]|uniref:hypothetical protein n=1 Tax=Leifsonia sp. 2TAF2 TaxID=3233009 RepID=UPI003F9866E1
MTVTSVHWLFIALHAGFAVAGFALGCAVLIRIPTSVTSRRVAWFGWCVIAAMVLLVTLVAVDWARLTSTKQIAFGILSLLAVYMIVRVAQARRALVRQRTGWRKAFIGHVGFVMISLFDGFCIVSAIDLRLPPAAIVGVAVLGVVVGVVVIRALVRRDAAGENVRAA